VYVYLDLYQDMSHPKSQVDHEALVEELRDRVRFLERELDRRSVEAERYQHIVAGLARANANLTDRLKELEAPAREPVASREPSGVPESVVEEPERAEESQGTPRSGTGGPQEGAEKKSVTEEEPESRSWWRRVFGA
jgi:hypothetical protein